MRSGRPSSAAAKRRKTARNRSDSIGTPIPRVIVPYGGRTDALADAVPGGYAAAARHQRVRQHQQRQQGAGTLSRLLSRVARTLTRTPADTAASPEPSSPHAATAASTTTSSSGAIPTDAVGGAADGVDPSKLIAPLSPGAVVRDFAFFTQNAEVQFFSTHPTLLDAVFGLSHGQQIRFSRGAWAGKPATVVGTRGASLWVLLAGDSVARELPLPTAPSTTTSSAPSASATTGGPPEAVVLGALQAHYGLEVTPLLVDSIDSSDAAVAAGFPEELLEEVEKKASRLFSAEQRLFLQCAPDLFVSVVDDDGGSGEDRDLTSEGESEPEWQEGDGAGNGTLGGDGGSDSLSFYQRVVVSAVEAARGRRGRGRKVVVLPPRIVLSSGTVGWGGEGPVVVNGGGVRAFGASMSASIVV